VQRSCCRWCSCIVRQSNIRKKPTVSEQVGGLLAGLDVVYLALRRPTRRRTDGRSQYPRPRAPPVRPSVRVDPAAAHCATRPSNPRPLDGASSPTRPCSASSSARYRGDVQRSSPRRMRQICQTVHLHTGMDRVSPTVVHAK